MSLLFSMLSRFVIAFFPRSKGLLISWLQSPACDFGAQEEKYLSLFPLFPYTTLFRSYGFSSGHVWMWELDSKESWAPKNWCFWTVVLQKAVESPLDYKEIKPVNPKENQPWIFIGRTDAEGEAPILWPPDATPQFKSINSSVLSFHYSPTLTSIHEYWENHSLN